MKRQKEKARYVILGILVSLVISFFAELILMFSGENSYFMMSISGLKYQFLLLPLFVYVGVICGYLFWFFFRRT